MTLLALTPVERGSGAVLGRRNPVAKLAAAGVVSFGLLATLDPVAPAVALCGALAVVPLFGLTYGFLLRRSWPILLSAGGVAGVQLLFGTAEHRALAAAGLALRVLAIAVPSIVTFMTIDPTDLADALVQQVRVSPRFAIGALAGLRLLPLLAAEWQSLTRARRARGIDAGRSPGAHLRLFASTMFALLVAAIRRATRLATAMDARGFAAGTQRSCARRQRFTAADTALVLGALALLVLALGASLAAGTFRTVG